MAELMQPRFVFARQSMSIGWEGRVFPLAANQAWLADDPLVRAYPGLFSAVPLSVGSSGIAERPAKQIIR